MTFLAPWFLLGLLAAAVPVIIHLRRSTRTTRLVFSTTRFFDDQFVRSARRARVQDLLLMLLRMLLLALFALALAQPLLRLPGLAGLAALTGGARTVAIVLDDSASMSRATSGGTLIDRAKAGAIEVVDALSEHRGDRVTVALGGRREGGARVLFTEPTSDLRAVREAIARVTTTDLAADLSGAVEAAGLVIGGGKGGAGQDEVYIFSDMQQSGFAGSGGLSAGSGVTLVFVAVQPPAAERIANASVVTVSRGAARPVVGVPFVFRAMIHNHGEASMRGEARLVVNDDIVAKSEVQLPPGRGRVVRFTHPFAAPGWQQGRVEFAPFDLDAIAADNSRHFVANVAGELSILAVNGAPSRIPPSDELFFLRLALGVGGSSADGHAAPAINIRQIELGELAGVSPDEHPLLVLANVARFAPAELDAMQRYADAGGSVLVTLGDRVEPESYNQAVGVNRLHGGLFPGTLAPLDRGRSADGQEPAVVIADLDQEHPALVGFGGERLGGLGDVQIRTMFKLTAPLEHVVMQASDRMPLLAEKAFGRGRVMMLTTSIDRDWTNLPLQPAYVPLVHRIVGYLAQGGMAEASFVRTGELVQLPTSTTQMRSTRIVSPAGDSYFPELRQMVAGAAPAMVFDAPERAGVYEWQDAADADRRPIIMFAANIPPDEADTAAMGQAAILALAESHAPAVYLPSPESVAQQARVARQGYGIWNHLLVLALIAALIEPWIANTLARRARGAASAVKRRIAA